MGKIWTPGKRIAEFGYRAKNTAALLRAIKVDAGVIAGQAFGLVTMHGELRGELIHSDGGSLDLGLLGKRVVTDAGVAYLVDDWDGGANDFSSMNFHDSGTGAVAENVTDTALGAAAGPARVSGTKSQPAANQAQTVATVAYTATLAITEHGIFSASTAGSLWDRTVFAAVNVVSGDSIQFTYTLTINAGG